MSPSIWSMRWSYQQASSSRQYSWPLAVTIWASSTAHGNNGLSHGKYYDTNAMVEIYERPATNYCFAKTDYDSDRKKDEYKWQRDVMPKRPKHSCESVAIGRPLIRASLGINKMEGRELMPVLRAICGAIARHHSSQASKLWFDCSITICLTSCG